MPYSPPLSCSPEWLTTRPSYPWQGRGAWWPRTGSSWRSSRGRPYQPLQIGCTGIGYQEGGLVAPGPVSTVNCWWVSTTLHIHKKCWKVEIFWPWSCFAIPALCFVEAGSKPALSRSLQRRKMRNRDGDWIEQLARSRKYERKVWRMMVREPVNDRVVLLQECVLYQDVVTLEYVPAQVHTLGTHVHKWVYKNVQLCTVSYICVQLCTVVYSFVQLCTVAGVVYSFCSCAYSQRSRLETWCSPPCMTTRNNYSHLHLEFVCFLVVITKVYLSRTFF